MACKTCLDKGVIDCDCRLITCDECMAPDEERLGIPCPDCRGAMDADDWDGREDEGRTASMDLARHHYRG